MTAQSQPAQPLAGPSQGQGYAAAPANARIPAGTQLLDQDLLAQSSVYLPGATEKLVKEGKYKPPPGKRQTVVRKGGGKTWEDTSLLDWDPSKSARPSGRWVVSPLGRQVERSLTPLSLPLAYVFPQQCIVDTLV